jgi:sigma-E factor negative regulatory protein RseB
MTITRSSTACWLMLWCIPALAQDGSPNEWLDRMASVVDTTDFQGTVIRSRGGQSQALKVTRRIVDGVVHEKLVSQEGNGLEVIRKGSEVHCILPDKKSVLVEYWNDDVTLFSTLPSSDLRFGSEYDLSIVREERVAGRRAMLLAVRPHDGYRYGYRIWLDRETGFPLRTELVGGDGSLLEQLKFADIRFNPQLPGRALEPSFDLDGFTWYPEPARGESVDIDSEWVSDDLPAGFKLVSAAAETLPGTDEVVTHLMYSDGLASLSVFIAAADGEQAKPRGDLDGASNSHSISTGDFVVTAIGQVPQATVRRVAVSMHRE